MIDITKTPNLISFAGNPVIFEASSDNYLISCGTNAYFELVISSVDTTIGHHFTLNFASKTIVFTSAVSTGHDPCLFSVATSGQSFNDFSNNIYQCFIINYYLQKYFIITLDPIGASQRKIILSARNPGADCSVTLSSNGVSGVAEGLNTPGTNNVYRDFFSILCLIRDSYGISIGEDIKPEDEIGCATFDISDYIKAKFATWKLQRFQFPELAGNFIVRGWDYLIKYRCSFAESIAGNVQCLLPHQWKYALSGGLNHELQTSLNQNNLQYFSIPANKLKFLSWLPLSKYSRSGVLEKLFFLFQDNPTNIEYRLRVLITFTDSSQLWINATPPTIFDPFSVVEFKVGFDHLDLANASYGKTVKSWQVYLLDNNDILLSEMRLFYNDTRFFENEKVFFYRNSFSAYDTFRFFGKSELNLEYERSIGITIREENYSFFNAPSQQFSANETENCKANSGWITLAEKNCLRELLLSVEAYEQIGNELFQIVVNTAKITPFLKDGDYLYNLEIEYNRSYQNSFYSVHVPDSSTNQLRLPEPLTWDNTRVSLDNSQITFDQTSY